VVCGGGAVYDRYDCSYKGIDGLTHQRLIILTSRKGLGWGEEGDFVAILLEYFAGEGGDGSMVQVFTSEARPWGKTAVVVKGVLGEELGKEVWAEMRGGRL